MDFINALPTTWQFWAFLSAATAALTAIFAKLGVILIAIGAILVARSA